MDLPKDNDNRKVTSISSYTNLGKKPSRWIGIINDENCSPQFVSSQFYISVLVARAEETQVDVGRISKGYATLGTRASTMRVK